MHSEITKLGTEFLAKGLFHPKIWSHLVNGFLHASHAGNLLLASKKKLLMGEPSDVKITPLITMGELEIGTQVISRLWCFLYSFSVSNIQVSGFLVALLTYQT